MKWTPEDLDVIFEKTDGKCHVCHKPMTRRNYGQPGTRNAWEVDHSRPRAKGGSDHISNLYAAHIVCNRSKGTESSRSARAKHGFARAPLSADAKVKKKSENALKAGAFGAVVGAALAGPAGAAAMGALAAVLGHGADPDA
jgi:5-methylcytosine-specific restriction endonuclease McrA